MQGSENGNPESAIINNRFNDGKCDPQGRLWVGSMDVNCNGAVGSLYSFEADEADSNRLVCKKQLDNVGVSNGIVWTGDGKPMYYIDTMTQKLDAFDFDGSTGSAESPLRVQLLTRTQTTVLWLSRWYGCIDSNDTLWIAMWT